MTLLVFDSGLGGLTTLAAIRAVLPGVPVAYLADNALFPYGQLEEAALVERVIALMEEAIARLRPDLVVIACNTASTLVLPALRARFALPFVGTVPAVKPAAALSRSRLASVLATPGTVARDYTRRLIADHGRDCRFTLVGAPHLATLAEAALAGAAPDEDLIAAEIRPCFVEQDGRRTDVVVLACTHYPLIAEALSAAAPWPVTWIDPAPAIARRVAAVLAGTKRQECSGFAGADLFLATGALPADAVLARFGFGKAARF